MSDGQAQPQELIIEQLPLSGIHLIEASAGTGKTFNITRLYLRLLLERELGVQQILVMTFTRAATAELKGRLAAELDRALEHWEELDEDFYSQMRARLPDTRKVRALLHNARLHLNEAAIYTIHGFCRRALTREAFVSGISFHAAMETDSSTLVTEALEDWYREMAASAEFAQLQEYCPTPRQFADTWKKTIVGSEAIPEPQVPAVEDEWQAFRQAWSPASAAGEATQFAKLNIASRRSPDKQAYWQQVYEQLTELSACDWPGYTPEPFGKADLNGGLNTEKKRQAMPCLSALAERLAEYQRSRRAWWAWRGIIYAREHLARSKDRLDQLDFDDLIHHLRERIEAPETAAELAHNLGTLFPAALVDEFQDTDPNQYAILHAIYSQERAQQSLLCMIGDPKQAIYAFRGGDVFAYLKARNDADQQWVMNRNFRSAPEVIAGYNRLFYGKPLPAGGDPTHPETFTGLTASTGVFGYGIAYHPVIAGRAELSPPSGPAKRAAFQWGLLPADAQHPGLNSKGSGYTKQGQHALAAWSAAEARRLLDEEPFTPSDIAVLVRTRDEAQIVRQALHEVGLDSVYLSSRDNVLDSPEAEELLRALTGILHLEDERTLIAALSTSLFGYETASLYALQNDEREWARLLEEIAELRERWQRHGFMSMALRLVQQRYRPQPERHERALTNTLHLLELLQEASQLRRQPEALLQWFRQARNESTEQNNELRLENDGHLVRIVTLHGAKGLEYPVVFHPFASYGRRSQIGKELLVRYHDPQDYSPRLAFNPGQRIVELASQEDNAEAIRLLYVGATRGERRVYLLAAAFDSLANSPLAHCLGAQDFEDLTARVEEHAREGAAGVIDLRHDKPSLAQIGEQGTATQLAPAEFTGRIERDWWLCSFSALTRNIRHGGNTARDRDAEPPTPITSEGYAADATTTLRFGLARGAETGNLLHDMLENLDFTAPDWGTAMERAATRYPSLLAAAPHSPSPRPRADSPPDEQDQRCSKDEDLQGWLDQILHTELPSGARLADLPARQTRRESAFYFPMNCAQRPALGRILAAHRGCKLAAPHSSLAPHNLKGMMQGYIDLIYQWQGRFYLVDYKSNFLGPRFHDYDPERLEEDIRASFYDLQYLLYTLALHRYLKTKLSDYDPQHHLGGVHYLYLRGMAPGQQTGIYHVPVDQHALADLDALFEGKEGSA